MKLDGSAERVGGGFERGGIGRWERWEWIEMQWVVSGIGGVALVYESVCVCVCVCACVCVCVCACVSGGGKW